ncbi:MAG: DUF2809 domain-containing protein [Ignavibacteria bacterium]
MNQKRNRLVYFISIIVVIAAGLGTRKYPGLLPKFIAEYSGDTLWALMVFLLTGFIFNSFTTTKVAVISLVFSFAIEFSQLYSSEWFDAIRHTLLGGLIFGYGFLWSDLICYIIGVTTGVLLEKTLLFKQDK